MSCITQAFFYIEGKAFGQNTHPPKPVLKTTSPATEDGWPKE